MTLRRHRFFLMLPSLCALGLVSAQSAEDGNSGTSSGGEGSNASSENSGASSAFGSPSGTTPTGGGSAFDNGAPAFRTGQNNPLNSNSGSLNASGTPDYLSTGADNAGNPPKLEAVPRTYNFPGFYGRGPIQLTSGEDRLAQPRYRFTISTSQGYDDNIYSTPTHTPNIPGVAKQERQGSGLSIFNVGFDTQFGTPRSLLTLNSSVGIDYYWDQPNDDVDYNGNLSLLYLYKFSPRLQLTAALSAAYQNQPDLAAVNNPTRTNSSYFALNSKVDLSYRFTPRFSNVTSVSYGAILYKDQSAEFSNFGFTTIGTELRYLYNPRLTFSTEFRFSFTNYDRDSSRDSHSFFALFGGDFLINRRLTGSLRVGAEIREADTGGSDATPFVEASLSYRLARQTTVSWTNRYGFEEPPSNNSESQVFRTSLAVTHSFTPRIVGSAALNYIHQETTFNDGQSGFSEDTVGASASLQYIVNRHWSLNGSYSYIVLSSNAPYSDYYRNQVFLGAAYQF